MRTRTRAANRCLTVLAEVEVAADDHILLGLRSHENVSVITERKHKQNKYFGKGEDLRDLHRRNRIPVATSPNTAISDPRCSSNEQTHVM